MNEEKQKNNNEKIKNKKSFDAEKLTQIVYLKIEGMDCNDESQIIEKKLKK